MPEQLRIGFEQLEVGHEFPVGRYTLDPSMVSAYIEAVSETSNLYQDQDLVPPMAIAACALAALSENIVLAPGTIHVSQEFDFLGSLRVGDTVTSHARVSRKQQRGAMRVLNIDLDICDTAGKTVLKGKTSFILPQGD